VLVETTDFAEIAAEFRRRVEQTQWASMTTVDERGRPRGRLVHPVWEEPVGWLATGRHSFKARHLERNPYVSLVLDVRRIANGGWDDATMYTIGLAYSSRRFDEFNLRD